ncbi:MAG: serine/threonine protein kinase [Polyangiaceae bacterium]|nr:serine/threonine protein kinase [Myxococcales bacterium]MCB9590020.1 serine/threonine protein kinase [Polyangiaceae bacterium]
MTSPAPTPKAGDSLGRGRYAVTQLIGEGAQGQTLQAIDKRDGTLVAIKRFSVRGASSWKDVELAEREARVLAQLDHPALPRHLDHFEEDGALYLVMTLVEGESLAELRRQGKLLGTAEVRTLLTQMADVLGYLSQRAPPVIHRDIKPSNIVRRPDGSYALVDFGSVRDHLKADGSTVVGTFGYMAPEQFQGRALAVSDVYGLGATALTLLTGVAPDQQPHRGLGIDVESALGAGADSELVALLSGMLTPDPDVRTRDLKAALRAAPPPPHADYWQAGSPSVDDSRPAPSARPFAPPFILVIFGAGFWFSSSSQFSLMLPLMSLMIAGVVWYYMSGGLKRKSTGGRERVRVSDHTRVRVQERLAEPLEDTRAESPARNVSTRQRHRR